MVVIGRGVKRGRPARVHDSSAAAPAGRHRAAAAAWQRGGVPVTKRNADRPVGTLESWSVDVCPSSGESVRFHIDNIIDCTFEDADRGHRRSPTACLPIRLTSPAARCSLG
jgi:hypothetical protein